MSRLDANQVEKTDFKQIRQIMKERLKKSRYQHTLGVEKMARKLAKRHGVDEEKAALAALLHDYGKHLKVPEMIQYAKEHQIEVDSVTEKNMSLLHGKVGAALVCENLGICDADILNAIRYHTYGRVGMSKLEKLIYIADAIEPGREYPDVDKLRELAIDDLDEALKMSVGRTIAYVASRGELLHLNTVELWNELVG